MKYSVEFWLVEEMWATLSYAPVQTLSSCDYATHSFVILANAPLNLKSTLEVMAYFLTTHQSCDQGRPI